MNKQRKYSEQFQRVIDACKQYEWKINKRGEIRVDDDNTNTCPLSAAMGQHGLCDIYTATETLNLRNSDIAYKIACAADYENNEKSQLIQRIRTALVVELKPKRQ